MFGLTFEKVFIISIIAAFLLGPTRLPLAAEWLAGVVRSVKAVTNGAKERIREEVGPEFDQVEWKKLDPRQFDPRRIMAEALRDADPIAGVERTPTSGSADVARDDASSQPRGVR